MRRRRHYIAFASRSLPWGGEACGMTYSCVCACVTASHSHLGHSRGGEACGMTYSEHDIYFSALPRRRSRHHMSSLKPSRGGEACGMTYNRAYACVAGSVAVHTGQECSLSDIHACRPSHMGLARMRCRRSRPCSHTLAGRARFQHAYSSWASPRGTDAPGLARLGKELPERRDAIL